MGYLLTAPRHQRRDYSCYVYSTCIGKCLALGWLRCLTKLWHVHLRSSRAPGTLVSYRYSLFISFDLLIHSYFHSQDYRAAFVNLYSLFTLLYDSLYGLMEWAKMAQSKWIYLVQYKAMHAAIVPRRTGYKSKIWWWGQLTHMLTGAVPQLMSPKWRVVR